MTEVIGNCVFSIQKSAASGNFVTLVGRLDSGSLAIGWKTGINGKLAEVTDILISSIHPEKVVVTIRGVTIDDIEPIKSLEFKTEIL